MKQRILSLIVVFTLACALSSCIETKMHFLVKKDGSGTVTTSLVVPSTVYEMMDEEKGRNKGKLELLSKFTDSLSNTLGSDAKLSNVQLTVRKDGNYEVKSIHEFSDISKVKVSAGPTGDITSIADMGISFKFDKKDSSVLTINVEKAEGDGESDEIEELAKEANLNDEEIKLLKAVSEIPNNVKLSPEELEERLKKAMNSLDKNTDDAELTKQTEKIILDAMAEVLKGMKYKISVEVDGEIAFSNASHCNKEKRTLTLFELDFDKIIANEKAKKAFFSDKSADGYSELFKANVDGAKGEPLDKTVTVIFK